MNAQAQRLADRILATGPIPFAAFMEGALYGEGGYYRRKRLPIGPGPDDDFATAPSLSPLFGRCTARLLRRLDGALGHTADYLEAGPGNGDHLASLNALERPGSDSTVVRRGAALVRDHATGAGRRRILAWDRVSRRTPPGVERLSGIEDLAPGTIDGLIFSCELFDALPVHRLLGRPDGTVGELYVALDDEGAFGWQEGELSDAELTGRLGGVSLEPGQIADLTPGWARLYRSLARLLGRGLLVTVDYGYERERLLDPRARRHGTLACYRRHRVHRDPFLHVADQDLTAHVDFTALRRAGEAEGLETLAFVRLTEWLTRLEIFDDLQDATPEIRRQALSLLDPGGIGHDLRVLVQSRRIETGTATSLASSGWRAEW